MGTTRDLIADHLGEIAQLAGAVGEVLGSRIEEVAELVLSSLRQGGRLFFCGNGGSAADAQHLAAEYVIRFRGSRRALPALALTTDTSVLTAGANDLGYDTVFARQIEALAREGDLLFLHSTSGESDNLLLAAREARERGVTTVAFLAKGGGPLASLVDHALVVPTESTARAQEMHLAMGHIVCHLVDAAIMEEEEEEEQE